MLKLHPFSSAIKMLNIWANEKKTKKKTTTKTYKLVSTSPREAQVSGP